MDAESSHFCTANVKPLAEKKKKFKKKKARGNLPLKQVEEKDEKSLADKI